MQTMQQHRKLGLSLTDPPTLPLLEPLGKEGPQVAVVSCWLASPLARPWFMSLWVRAETTGEVEAVPPPQTLHLIRLWRFTHRSLRGTEGWALVVNLIWVNSLL